MNARAALLGGEGAKLSQQFLTSAHAAYQRRQWYFNWSCSRNVGSIPETQDKSESKENKEGENGFLGVGQTCSFPSVLA